MVLQNSSHVPKLIVSWILNRKDWIWFVNYVLPNFEYHGFLGFLIRAISNEITVLRGWTGFLLVLPLPSGSYRVLPSFRSYYPLTWFMHVRENTQLGFTKFTAPHDSNRLEWTIGTESNSISILFHFSEYFYMGLPCCKRDFRVLLRLTLVNLFFFLFQANLEWNDGECSALPLNSVVSCPVATCFNLIGRVTSTTQWRKSGFKKATRKNKNKTKNPLRKKKQNAPSTSLESVSVPFFRPNFPSLSHGLLLFRRARYFHWVLPSFVGFYRVLSDFTGFYWLLWSFKVPLPF